MLKAVILTLCLVFSGTTLHAGALEDTFAAAQQAYKGGKFEEAGTLFLQVADLLSKQGARDKSYAFLNNAGISYMKAKKYPAAIAVYSRVLKNAKRLNDKTLSQAYKNIIECYNQTRQFALRIDAIEKFLKAMPRMPMLERADWTAGLGDMYRRLEVYHQAITYYEKSLDMLGDQAPPQQLARILTGLGLSFRKIGQFDAATHALTLANSIAQKTKSHQTIAQSNSNLGILFWERGDYAKAQEFLNAALEVEKKENLKADEGGDQNNLGLLFKDAGKFKEAMSHFVTAIAIGQQIGNKEHEAIGLVNKALLHRMTGQLSDARADYRKAEQLFREVNFKEGIAGALLGQGVIAEREDRDLTVALNLYTEALNIYTELGLVRAQAETYNQIGRIFKTIGAPSRSTRDLVFDDEPVVPQISKNDALAKALDSYKKALVLAEQISSKVLIWSAWQGIGYCLYQEGKLEQAYKYYMQAIDMVTSMRTDLASVSLLGEYMAGKEDLYGEAREVSAALYAKTKQQKYLEKQMQLDETLRNEISKASLALVQVKFEDPKKQLAYEKLITLGKEQEKAEKAIPMVPTATKSMSANEKKEVDLKKQEAKKQVAVVKKLDADYKKQLAAWEKSYPEDAVIFQSASRVDLKKIQKNLEDDQAVLQYLPLNEKLIILAISNKKVEQYIVNVSQSELDNIVKKEFLVGYIEKYGRGKHNGSDTDAFLKICETMHKLYQYLVEPAESFIADKKKLYFVASGFLAQVPFVSLTKEYNENTANFLVEKYDISQVRPSFIESLSSPVSKESLKTLLAVGNPRNTNIFMADLNGAKIEVQNADASISNDAAIKDIRYEKNATENWLIEQLRNSQYEYIYFATHAMPFSDVYMTYINNYDKKIKRFRDKYKDSPSDNPREDPNVYEMLSYGKMYIDSQLPGYSPVNGYLYMQADKEFNYDGSQKPLPDNNDGLLTITDIMRLDKKSFEKTRVVVLSACNTGVTFAPKTVKNETFNNVLSAAEVEQSLRKAGWIPGVDQVSFVDVFMRRGVSNVYGTLWFVDDQASSYILSHFMQNMQKAGSNGNVVHEYSRTLRDYIALCKANNKPINAPMPIHPYFWAAGSFFGK